MIKNIVFHPSRPSCNTGAIKGVMTSIKGVHVVGAQEENHTLSAIFDDSQTSEAAIIKQVGQQMGIALHIARPECLLKSSVDLVCGA